MRSLSRSEIISWIRIHQRRLKAGDDLPTISELANRAGIHRDSIYALLQGDLISLRTQYALSRAISEIDEELVDHQKTRVMTVRLGPRGPGLMIGASSTPILAKR
jgi:DNA-binding transcriptional regulator YhcF (GntR family)